MDYDVDKLFTYQYNTFYKDGKLSIFNLPKNANSAATEKHLQNKYIDLHWSILTNPQMTDKILAPLDINDFGDAVELVGSSDKSLYPESLISASFNEKQFLENRSAKTGVAAESLMATFNALSQGTDLNLVQEIKKGDETVTEPFDFKVTTASGRVIKLSKLSSSTGLKGLGNTLHRVYRQKEDGSYEVVDTIKRTKSDSIMNLQSEAVDNAKSGNLGKGNINDYTMAAINSLARLESSDSENNILPMNSLIWFIKQQSIVDYVRQVQTLNDTTVEDFNPNKKQEMIISLMDKYYDMIGTPENQREYTHNKDYAIPVELSNDKSNPGLFELLKKDGIDNKVWASHQLNILKTFITLDELGALERNSISALNSDSKGVGKSLIASSIKEQNYIDVANGNKKSNASIDGNPTMKIEGFENIANSDRQIGQATENSVMLANELYSRFYPYKAPLMQRIFSIYSMFTGKNKETQINENEQRSLINAFKSFAFTNPILNLFDESIDSERKRLLTTQYDDKYKIIEVGDLKSFNSPTKSRVTTYEDLPNGIYRTKNNTFLKITKMGKLDFNKTGSLNLKMVDINGKEFNLNTEAQLNVLANREGYETFLEYKSTTFGSNNKFFKGESSKYLYSFELVSGVDIKSQSLAKRLNTMKVKYPENYLIKRLSSELSRDVTREFDLVKYSSAITQKLDDIENTRALAELLTSQDADTREFANDLIKYSYITGGIQNAISFIKYIPSQVLMRNDFSQGLRDIQTALEVADTNIINHISFLRQYFQHNPYKALKLNEEELFGKDGRIPQEFTIPKNNPTKYETSVSGIRNKLIGADSQNQELRMEQEQAQLFSASTAPKFAYLYDVVNKKPLLFEAVERPDGFHYTRLPLLGTSKIGSTEYDSSTNEVVSSALESKNNMLLTPTNNVEVSTPIVEQTQETPKTSKSSLSDKLTTTQSKKLLQDILKDIAKQDSSQGELAKVLLAHPKLQSASIGLFTQEELESKKNVVATAYSGTNEIKLNKDKLGTVDFNNTILHEVLHLTTSLDYNTYALDANTFKQNNAEKARIFEQLDKHRDSVKAYLNAGNSITLKDGSVVNKAGLDEFNKKSASGGYSNYDNLDVGFYYGLTNTKEFISVLMTDATMQEVLSKIPYSNKTLWDRIKDLFSRFVSQLNKELGTKVDNSILSEAVGNVLDLVTLQNKVAEKEENKLINVYSTNKNGFEKLSNLLTNPVTINVNGKQVTFKTVEHAYQAKKALFAGDRDVANKIYNAENGWAAQKLSRTINGLKSKEWDAISESVLEDIMTQYYNQDSSAKQLLLSTRNSELTHKSDRNLGKWGEVFPKILMKIRDSFNRSKEDNLIAPEELSSVEKQLLKSRKFNLLKTSTGQQVITLPMKPQSAYLEARREIIKLNKEYGEGSATISNRIVLDKGKEIQVEAVKINTNQNVFEVNDVNSFLEQLAPSERLLFRKLKLNHTIETKC